MKIIAKGRPQSGWAKDYVCTGIGNGGGGCLAKLLVEQDDIFQFSPENKPSIFSFKCALCGVETNIPQADLANCNWTCKRPKRKDWLAARVGAKEVPQFIGAQQGNIYSGPDDDCG